MWSGGWSPCDVISALIRRGRATRVSAHHRVNIYGVAAEMSLVPGLLALSGRLLGYLGPCFGQSSHLLLLGYVRYWNPWRNSWRLKHSPRSHNFFQQAFFLQKVVFFLTHPPPPLVSSNLFTWFSFSNKILPTYTIYLLISFQWFSPYLMSGKVVFL